MAWWRTPLITALGRQARWISEFKTSLGYKVRPCLKKKKKQKRITFNWYMLVPIQEARAEGWRRIWGQPRLHRETLFWEERKKRLHSSIGQGQLNVSRAEKKICLDGKWTLSSSGSWTIKELGCLKALGWMCSSVVCEALDEPQNKQISNLPSER